jgi:hypothetical protein
MAGSGNVGGRFSVGKSRSDLCYHPDFKMFAMSDKYGMYINKFGAKGSCVFASSGQCPDLDKVPVEPDTMK